MGKKYNSINYIVEGLLPVGLTVFTGREKIEKSFLLLQLAGSICNGESFMEHEVEKSEVLYLALEDTDARLNN